MSWLQCSERFSSSTTLWALPSLMNCDSQVNWSMTTLMEVRLSMMPVEHELGGLADLGDDLLVAVLEAAEHLPDLLLDLGVRLHHLVGLLVVHHQAVVGLVALDGGDVLRPDVLQPPGQQHDLLADVVDIVLGGDVVTVGAHASGQRVADDGVAGPADVDRAGRVHRGVLQQHLFPRSSPRP